MAAVASGNQTVRVALVQPVGWVVVVDHGSKWDVYDVAIADPIAAVKALKEATEVPSGARVTIKSQLSPAQLKALRLEQGGMRCHKTSD